ncbi:MAG: hypothetical protein AB1898_27555 [Acidobacteriota bacterium]
MENSTLTQHHVSNLNVANAGAGTNHVAIWGRKGSERAELSLRGASFWGFLKQILRWENLGTVSLSDSRLIPWDTQQPMVEILAGRAFLHDNLLQRYRQGRTEGKWSLRPVTSGKDAVGFRVGPDAENAMVHGNQLTGNAIVNEAKQRALLANNQP